MFIALRRFTLVCTIVLERFMLNKVHDKATVGAVLVMIGGTRCLQFPSAFSVWGAKGQAVLRLAVLCSMFDGALPAWPGWVMHWTDLSCGLGMFWVRRRHEACTSCVALCLGPVVGGQDASLLHHSGTCWGMGC